MAYDRELAERIREHLAGESGVSERAMFGGLAFLVDGAMAVAASGQGGLLARVDPAEAPALLSSPGVTRMVMRGREMRGWLRVDAAALDADADLAAWVARGARYARSQPPK
jgi:TfoX/Sxy family transcriptional regulator of competence genes